MKGTQKTSIINMFALIFLKIYQPIDLVTNNVIFGLR